MSRGVLTLATGAKRYIDQAVNLGRSIRFHNPDLPIAIVTDSSDAALDRVFDYVHTFRPELGSVFRQKLCLNEYSEFSKTLFIDSDCLVFRDLEPLFSKLDTDSFSIPATPIRDGTWYRDVEGWLMILKAESIPKLNSGCFTFAKTKQADAFFASAKNYYDHLENYSIPKTHSHMSDEPAIAMALLQYNISCPQFDNTVQVNALDAHFNANYSVLRKRLVGCRRTDGGIVHPFILHCLAGEHKTERYFREQRKLRWCFEKKMPSSIAEKASNLLYFQKRGWREYVKHYILHKSTVEKGADLRLNRLACVSER